MIKIINPEIMNPDDGNLSNYEIVNYTENTRFHTAPYEYPQSSPLCGKCQGPLDFHENTKKALLQPVAPVDRKGGLVPPANGR